MTHGFGASLWATAAVDTGISGMEAEAVEMRVAPPQGNLQGVMKIGDHAVSAEQKPAPDHAANQPEDYFELMNIGFN